MEIEKHSAGKSTSTRARKIRTSLATAVNYYWQFT